MKKGKILFKERYGLYSLTIYHSQKKGHDCCKTIVLKSGRKTIRKGTINDWYVPLLVSSWKNGVDALSTLNNK